MQKGARLLGVSANYFKTSDNNQPEDMTLQKQANKNSNFNSELRLGYFITNKVAIGLIGRYANSTTWQQIEDQRSTYTANSRSNTGSYGLFVRGYKLFKEDKFGFFCQLEGTYSQGNSVSKTSYWGIQVTMGEQKEDLTGINLALRPGLVYFFTNKIGIEGSLGGVFYNTSTRQRFVNGSKTSKNTSDGFNLNLGLNTIYLGINFYLGGK